MKIVTLIVLVAVAGCTPPYRAKCDDAIKAKLRSPATYQRVSLEGGASDYAISIEYDAANAYGTPIRGKGTCYLENGRARWVEDRQAR